jgi:hypothetical protein
MIAKCENLSWGLIKQNKKLNKMKIRQGNDFIFLWTIVRNGIPEDLDNAKNIKLHFKNFDCIGEVKSFQIVDGNIVRVEVTPEWASRLGAYRLILSYEFEDQSYSDGDRKCVVDVLAFNIVAKTSEADDLTEVSKTTDIMIGFFGLSAYEVWLKDNPDKTKEDYYNWLRQPATDAVSLIDDKIEHLNEVIDSSTENEAERVTAENNRKTAEVARISAETERESNEAERLANEASRASNELIREANEVERLANEATRKTNENERKTAEATRISNENNRVTAEQARVNAESLRVTAETSRQTAEGLRVEAELLRQSSTQEAISNAEEAAENANTAAQNADDARLAIQDDLALKADQADLEETTEKPTAQSLSELNARITALEAILTNKIKDRIDITKEFNVWGKTNLILIGSGAATFAPDFIGQKYIDTTGGNVYIAVGTSNAGNWKLV